MEPVETICVCVGGPFDGRILRDEERLQSHGDVSWADVKCDQTGKYERYWLMDEAQIVDGRRVFRFYHGTLKIRFLQGGADGRGDEN